MMPPPTAVMGMIGAMCGIKRDEMLDFVTDYNLQVGAELRELSTIATEKATLMFYDSERKTWQKTVEDFEFLVTPTFRIVVHAKEPLIEEIQERINRYNFEFDIYGGISDCLLKSISNETEATFNKSQLVKGMIPVSFTEEIINQNNNGSRLYKVLYFNTFFYQGFDTWFKTKEELNTINDVVVWGEDDVTRFKKGIYN